MKRFQFSLRTMFIVVALICVWLGWQVNSVHNRATILKKLEDEGATILLPDDYYPKHPGHYWEIYTDRAQLSWFRRLLGDQFVRGAIPPHYATPEDRKQFQAAFPEAEIR